MLLFIVVDVFEYDFFGDDFLELDLIDIEFGFDVLVIISIETEHGGAYGIKMLDLRRVFT